LTAIDHGKRDRLSARRDEAATKAMSSQLASYVRESASSTGNSVNSFLLAAHCLGRGFVTRAEEKDPGKTFVLFNCAVDLSRGGVRESASSTGNSVNSFLLADLAHTLAERRSRFPWSIAPLAVEDESNTGVSNGPRRLVTRVL
jgi:hypothetical protein